VAEAIEFDFAFVGGGATTRKKNGTEVDLCNLPPNTPIGSLNEEKEIQKEGEEDVNEKAEEKEKRVWNRIKKEIMRGNSKRRYSELWFVISKDWLLIAETKALINLLLFILAKKLSSSEREEGEEEEGGRGRKRGGVGGMKKKKRRGVPRRSSIQSRGRQ